MPDQHHEERDLSHFVSSSLPCLKSHPVVDLICSKTFQAKGRLKELLEGKELVLKNGKVALTITCAVWSGWVSALFRKGQKKIIYELWGELRFEAEVIGEC